MLRWVCLFYIKVFENYKKAIKIIIVTRFIILKVRATLENSLSCFFIKQMIATTKVYSVAKSHIYAIINENVERKEALLTNDNTPKYIDPIIAQNEILKSILFLLGFFSVIFYFLICNFINTPFFHIENNSFINKNRKVYIVVSVYYTIRKCLNNKKPLGAFLMKHLV
jgi:hypothetical protein